LNTRKCPKISSFQREGSKERLPIQTTEIQIPNYKTRQASLHQVLRSIAVEGALRKADPYSGEKDPQEESRDQSNIYCNFDAVKVI
jgi:hypothetical protein